MVARLLECYGSGTCICDQTAVSPACARCVDECEERAVIVDDAEDNYRQVVIPLTLLGSLLPGAAAYVAAREIAAQTAAPRAGTIRPANRVRLNG